MKYQVLRPHFFLVVGWGGDGEVGGGMRVIGCMWDGGGGGLGGIWGACCAGEGCCGWWRMGGGMGDGGEEGGWWRGWCAGKF